MRINPVMSAARDESLDKPKQRDAHEPLGQPARPVSAPVLALLDLLTAFGLVGVSRSSGFEILSTGRLDAVEIGRRTLVTSTSFEQFLVVLPRAVYRPMAGIAEKSSAPMSRRRAKEG